MDYVAVTLKGIEDLASDEIKSALKSKPKKIAEGRLFFSAKNIDKFSPRLIKRIYSLIDYFDFSSEQELVKKCSKLKFSFKGTFVVRCSRQGVHDFDSRVVERDVGEIIYNKGFKVDLKNPDNIIVVDIYNNKCFIGFLVKDNLCKRPYRVKVFSSSINACLAAAAVKFSDIKPSHVLLDPFCRDGVIAIEAYLLGCKNVFAFDEAVNSIRNAKINSKLGGAKIKILKCGTDSLDLKFDEGSVDRIVTYPPFLSKNKKQKVIESIYSDFFYQARVLLKKSGALTILTPKPELVEQYASKLGFKKIKEQDVSVSNNNYKLIIFKKLK
ncbi:MAG: THUMP domain-containing protein [Candidatus Nanoarchaeia archaeon]